MSTTGSTAPAAPRAAWLSPKLYAKLWRLHFFAGFVAAPLVVWLCVTGILYIVGPQVEAVMYRDLLVVTPRATQVSFDDQLSAAQAAFPALVATGFHPSKAPDESAFVSLTTPAEARMVGMRHGGPTDAIRAYVDPYTGRVLGSLREDERYSHVMGMWHGNLYLGWFGRLLTEVGTAWTLALTLTGLYLWFPRRRGEVWGVWLTRIKGWKGRVWWRDFHSVGGLYTAALVLAFLLTAFMISWSTGLAFTLTRVALGQNVPAPPRGLASQGVSAAGAITLQSLDDVARQAGLADSYMISLPRTESGLYTISADNGMGAPGRRLDVRVDRFSGEVVHQAGWREYPWLLKLTVVGLGFHFGALFGAIGQVLGILACLAPIFFTVSGVVMWWHRKPARAWGLPKATPGGWTPFPRALVLTFALLAVAIPTFGASLAVALAVDSAVLRWLGRKRPAPVPAAALDASTAEG